MKKLEASSIKRPQSISWYPFINLVLEFVSKRRKHEEEKERKQKEKKGKEKKRRTWKAKEGKDQATSMGILTGNRLHV